MTTMITDSNSAGQGWRVRLAKQLKYMGWSQLRLAEEMGCSQGTVNHWLSGRREPSLETLNKLAKVLHMTASELITGLDRNKALIIEGMSIDQLRGAYAAMLVMEKEREKERQTSEIKVNFGEVGDNELLTA